MFADENRRIRCGFGGRKIPIAGIKKFPNVREIKIERSKIKNRTLKKFFRRIVIFSAQKTKKFCAENKRILRRIFSDYNYNFLGLRDFSFLKQERKLV